MKNKNVYRINQINNNSFVTIKSINSYDHPSKYYGIEKFLRDLNKQERLKKLKQCFGNDLKIEE
jgi:hypothetical protein